MILVIGGAGYIGSHMAKYLHDCGRQAVILDNLIYGHREFARWGTFIEGDMADADLLDRIFTDFDIEAVMHFAAFSLVGESVTDPARYYRNNIAATLTLLEAMRRHDVDTFIFSSTCAVYGVPERLPLTEDHPRRPINPYGRTKLAVEGMLEDFSAAYGLKYACLRYFNAAGADEGGEIGEWHVPETHLIPLVLDAACGRRESVSVFGSDYQTGDGTCVRDYIHVTDIAQAHVSALDHLKSGGAGGAFNLGNGSGYSVREVIETARRVTGREIPVTEAERRAGDPPVLVGSADRARDVLGWRPKFGDLETIIASAWKWHQRLDAVRKGTGDGR